MKKNIIWNYFNTHTLLISFIIICLNISAQLSFATSVRSIDKKITNKPPKNYQNSQSHNNIATTSETRTSYNYNYNYIFNNNNLDSWIQFYSEFLAFESYNKLIQSQKISKEGIVLTPEVVIADTHYKKSDKIKLEKLVCFYNNVIQHKSIIQKLKDENILTSEGRLHETEKLNIQEKISNRPLNLNLTKQKINNLKLSSQHNKVITDSLFRYMSTSLISYQTYSSYEFQSFSELIGYLFLSPLLYIPNTISRNFNNQLNKQWMLKPPEYYFPQFVTPKQYPKYVDYDHHIRYPDTSIFPKYYETTLSLFSSSDIVHFNNDIRAHFFGKSNRKFSKYWMAGAHLQGFRDSYDTVYTLSPYGGITSRMYNISVNFRYGLSYYNGININTVGMYIGSDLRYYIRKPISLFVNFNYKGNNLDPSWDYLSFRYGIEYQYKNIGYQISYHVTRASQESLLSGIEGGIRLLF